MSELNSAISPPMDITSYKSISSVKTSRVSIQPENRTSLSLTGSNQSLIHFALPSRPNSLLDGANSYLTFTYTFEGTTPTASADVEISNGTGASFINSLSTICGATECEGIQDYNAIACLIDDFQNDSRSSTLGTILEDKDDENYKSGLERSVATGGVGFTQKRRICIPLLSVICGTTGEKYFPMGDDLGVRLRLNFEAPDVALKCTTSAIPTVLGYSLDDITYEASYLEVEPSVYKSLESEAGGVFKVSGTGISSFQTTVGAGATQNTLLIPARFSSVRNMMTICRTNASISAKDGNSTGARSRDSISSYVYRVGGKNFPNLEVPADNFTSSEVMVELLKCFHSLHNTAQSVAFKASNWVDSSETTRDGAFAIGIDFEEAGFSNQIMGGLDTNSMNTFLELKHSSACKATTYNTYVFHDLIIEVDSNSGEVMVSR